MFSPYFKAFAALANKKDVVVLIAGGYAVGIKEHRQICKKKTW